MISNACCASAWQESISNRINSQRFIIVSYRNRLRAYFSRFHLQRHCSEGCSARRGLRRVVILHKQAATLQCAHRTVALRGGGRGGGWGGGPPSPRTNPGWAPPPPSTP